MCFPLEYCLLKCFVCDIILIFQPNEHHSPAGVGRVVPLPGCDGRVRQPALREDHAALHGADCLPSQPVPGALAQAEYEVVLCLVCHGYKVGLQLLFIAK